MTRQEAESAYQALLQIPRGPVRRQMMRDQALGDLYFLLVICCGRKDLRRDWIYDRCREVQAAPDGYLDLWHRGSGKAQPLDTPTLTPSGWRCHGDLRPGDEVFGPDGRPTTVVAISPVRERPSGCWEVVFDDGETAECGAGHLWTVEWRSWRRMPDGKREGRIPQVWSIERIAAWDHATPWKRLRIPVTKPLQFPPADLPIGPYTLGAWLGDGTASSGAITKPDNWIFERVAQEGYEVGPDITGKAKRNTRTVYGLRVLLRASGLLNNKHIPEVYLRGSEDQRRALVQGMLDTDGHVAAKTSRSDKPRAACEWTSKDWSLVTGMITLLRSLGIKVRSPDRERDAYMVGEHGPYWRIHFTGTTADALFSMPRKADRLLDRPPSSARSHRYIVGVRQIPARPCRCIQVARPDGQYLTGRGLVPTHNSSLITFGSVVQEILRNPEITVMILSFNRPTAKKFLAQIKREFETNQVLKDLFPEILWATPKSESQTWSEDNGIIMRRTGNPMMATVEAYGLVEGAPVGRHPDLVVYDDIVTEDSTTSEMAPKIVKAWELSLSIIGEGGRRRYAGTRYAFGDCYGTLLERGAAKPRVYPVIDDDGRPATWFTQDQIDEIRRTRGVAVWSSQYLLNPTADSVTAFHREWLRFHDGYSPEQAKKRMLVYLVVDPANAKRRSSDYTSMWVVGAGADKNYYVLDMLWDRLALPERIKAVFECHVKWGVHLVGYEAYGLQADVAAILMMQADQVYRFPIVELGGKAAKATRIERLLHPFEGGKILLPRTCHRTLSDGTQVDLVERFIHREYLPYPSVVHDDMLDALSRIKDPEFKMRFPDAPEIARPKLINPARRRRNVTADTRAGY